MKSVTAENIKKIIKQKGLLKSAVAERAGYNYKTFSNMLNGRKLITDIDVIIIANVLEVSPNELFGIQKEPEKTVV